LDAVATMDENMLQQYMKTSCEFVYAL